VANTLGVSPQFEVWLADDYDGAMRQIGERAFDVILLDLRMPGMVGLDSVQNVIRTAKGGYVVLFTGQIDRHVLDKALELGVRGLITKTMPLRSLVSVIELIASGQVFVPVHADLAAMIDDTGGETGGGLKGKGLFVLRLAADGARTRKSRGKWAPPKSP
jgi:two-component system nitrate/nitrite response regulator NarP